MQPKIKLSLIIILLLLSVLACSFGTDTEPLPDGLLFQDDFSDISSGWDRVNVNEGMTDYFDGVYRIYVNTDNTDYWANPGLDFTDTIVEVEATKVGGPEDNDFGLICRYQNTDNFYVMIISSDGYYGIFRVIDGVQEIIGSDEMEYNQAINEGDVVNIIKADCIGSTLTLYANGSQLISVQDSSFSSGDVGLIAGTFDEPGTDIHFDNFVVRQP